MIVSKRLSYHDVHNATFTRLIARGHDFKLLPDGVQGGGAGARLSIPLRGKTDAIRRQFTGGRIKVSSVFSRTPSTRDYREFSQETHPSGMPIKNPSTSGVSFESI